MVNPKRMSIVIKNINLKNKSFYFTYDYFEKICPGLVSLRPLQDCRYRLDYIVYE